MQKYKSGVDHHCCKALSFKQMMGVRVRILRFFAVIKFDFDSPIKAYLIVIHYNWIAVGRQTTTCPKLSA